MRDPFRYFNSSPEVIRLAVMMYVRYPLSLRQVEDLPFERGIDICHETVRYGIDGAGSAQVSPASSGNDAYINRAESPHQPFRRRERAMARFRDIKTLQKFASAHASIHNHFNRDRHLSSRDIFKQDRAAALAEWRQRAA